MKCIINPQSLANLRPPFRKGEVRNPKGINQKFGLEKFLCAIPRIAANIRNQGIEATPQMVTVVFVDTVMPKATAAEREKVFAELLPMFKAELRRGVM
jgi:hypothetical protein